MAKTNHSITDLFWTPILCLVTFCLAPAWYPSTPPAHTPDGGHERSLQWAHLKTRLRAPAGGRLPSPGPAQPSPSPRTPCVLPHTQVQTTRSASLWGHIHSTHRAGVPEPFPSSHPYHGSLPMLDLSVTAPHCPSLPSRTPQSKAGHQAFRLEDRPHVSLACFLMSDVLQLLQSPLCDLVLRPCSVLAIPT